MKSRPKPFARRISAQEAAELTGDGWVPDNSAASDEEYYLIDGTIWCRFQSRDVVSWYFWKENARGTFKGTWKLDAYEIDDPKNLL